MVSKAPCADSARHLRGYYRWTAQRPPRDLLLQTLAHIEWKGGGRRRREAVELGFGAGTDALELPRRGWRVLAIDRQATAAKILARRVPPRLQRSLTILIAPMEGLELPPGRPDLCELFASLLPAQSLSGGLVEHPEVVATRRAFFWPALRRWRCVGRTARYHFLRSGRCGADVPRLQGGTLPGNRRGRQDVQRTEALAHLRLDPGKAASVSITEGS